MKKAFLLLAVVFTTAVAAQAQVKIGVRAGANFSGFAGEGAKDNELDMIWGFHGGLTANFPVVEDFFSVQPEVLYSMKGAENEASTEEWKVNYIDVPLLGRFNAGPLYFEFGPQFSLKAGGEAVGTTHSKDDFKRTAFGYAAGLGFSATAIGASVGVRYTSDFTKLYKDDTHPDFRNSVFMFTLGFAFPGSR